MRVYALLRGRQMECVGEIKMKRREKERRNKEREGEREREKFDLVY